MLNIPYEKNRGSTCALSCYTMTARYFFPEVTFEQIAEISDWHKGYVIWGFRFWLWIMDKGIKITEYDLTNLEKWADKGFESLRDEMVGEEYKFIVENTWQINSYSEDIRKVLAHPNFIFKRERPTFQDLKDAFQRGAVCEVVLDATALDSKEGKIILHRVEILDITDEEITFHDPRTNNPRPKRKENIELFKKAWLERLDGPELCVYEQIKS